MAQQDQQFEKLNQRYWNLSIEQQARVQRMLPSPGSVDEQRYTRLFRTALRRVELNADSIKLDRIYG
jgi:hypothetical protein